MTILPKFEFTNGKAVVKVLMRTAEKIKPTIYSYNTLAAGGIKTE